VSDEFCRQTNERFEYSVQSWSLSHHSVSHHSSLSLSIHPRVCAPPILFIRPPPFPRWSAAVNRLARGANADNLHARLVVTATDRSNRCVVRRRWRLFASGL